MRKISHTPHVKMIISYLKICVSHLFKCEISGSDVNISCVELEHVT